MIFYSIFLLCSFFGTLQSQNFVNPITLLCPFRTGSAQFFEFNTSSTFTMLFDQLINFQPSNTLVGFNSIQFKTTNNSIMNIGVVFSMSVSEYTQILITLSLTNPGFYSRVSISFFTANQAWNAFKFTPIQWSQVENTTNLLDIILGLLSPDTSVYNISGAPPSNNGIVINKLKMLCQSSPCEMAPRMTSNTNINVNLKNIQTSSVNFQFSMITVNSSYTSNSTYGLQWGFSEQNISSSIYSSAKFALAGESDSSKFFFYGANSFSWNTKDQLSFRFQSDMQNYKFYNWVSNASYNYFEIFSIYFVFTQCVDPTHPNLLYRQQQCYDICPQGYYVTPLKRCLLCNLPNCTSCDSINNCILCDSSSSFIIVSGVCTQCNSDPTNVSSLLPLCVEEQPEPEPQPEPQPEPEPGPQQYPSQNPLLDWQGEKCFLSNYNNKTGQCDAIQQTQKITFALANVVATPTIGLFTKAFVELIGLFDDLSYYSYHNRNYTKAITVYFWLMTNFTLQRFLPSPLNQTYKNLSLFYSERILKQDLQRSPNKFVKNDGDVYFLKNTQNYWIGSVALSFLTFALLSFTHWLSNKCIRNRFFKRYNYFGMLLVDLIGCNVQFLSFRCFSQLYQTVSLGEFYNFNLSLCYLLIFILILFSASGFVIFRTFYDKLKKEYILDQLFGQSCIYWYVVYNLLKFFNGFIHAFFYYYPFLQTLLLTISIGIKAIIYTFTIKSAIHKIKYTFQVVGVYLMVLMQLFFLAQIFIIQMNVFDLMEQKLGNMEVILMLLILLNRLASTLILPIRDAFIFLKNRDFYSIRKNIIDIKTRKVKYSFQNNKDTVDKKSVSIFKQGVSKISFSSIAEIKVEDIPSPFVKSPSINFVPNSDVSQNIQKIQKKVRLKIPSVLYPTTSKHSIKFRKSNIILRTRLYEQQFNNRSSVHITNNLSLSIKNTINNSYTSYQNPAFGYNSEMKQEHYRISEIQKYQNIPTNTGQSSNFQYSPGFKFY